MTTVPADQGWLMPAEWEPHEATWLAWPRNSADWPGKFAPIPWIYTEIVRHLSIGEQVCILVNDAAARRQAEQKLRRAGIELGRIRFHQIPTDRVWTRDSGPIFLTRSGSEEPRVALTHWLFTAWRKYPDWQRDRQVPALIGKALGFPVFQVIVLNDSGNRHVVLEGGSIDVNGQGLLLTTEECLLSPVQERNPGFTRADYEAVFADYLGVRKVLWLGRGITGDDTHGHVDDLARFVGPRTVVVVSEDDPGDSNYEPLRENLQRLRSMTDLEGRSLEVVTLPMPAPLFFQGQRLPASYANFYIANDRVLMPTFNDARDRLALNTLAELFPGRAVVGIHAVDLVWGLGTLHCLTQQQPSGQ
ncbi:MAG: agmatine deiminase family protein [Gemmataceae bacterium]|nr:agmatine deiminase family protein [Gemmataceae bacterium]